MTHNQLEDGILIVYHDGKLDSIQDLSLNVYKIILVKQGVLEVKINENNILIERQNVLLLSLHVIFEIINKEEFSKCYFIYFTSDYAFNSTDLSSRIIIELFMVSAFTKFDIDKHLYRKIIKTTQLLKKQFENENDHYFQSIVSSNFNLLLLELASSYFENIDQQKIHWRSARIRISIRFYELVKENFKRTHNISDYAELLALSTSHLGRVVKETTGKQPRQIVDEFLLQEAKKMLQKDELNISEISEQLGFCNLAQFSNYFKKHTGKSPSNFRSDFN